MTFNERSLTVVLFEMNNELFDLYEHEVENRDLKDYLLIQLLFTNITLNNDYKRLCSCFSTRIKIIFTIYFIMSDDRSIINLLLYLIVAFDLFYDECDDFEFKKNSLLKLKSKSF